MCTFGNKGREVHAPMADIFVWGEPREPERVTTEDLPGDRTPLCNRVLVAEEVQRVRKGEPTLSKGTPATHCTKKGVAGPSRDLRMYYMYLQQHGC